MQVKQSPGTVQRCEAKRKPEVHMQSLEKCPIFCEKLHSTREPSEALIRKKVAWFKRERKEGCLKLQENAVEDNALIIAEFSDSHLASTQYRDFSVYDGKVHQHTTLMRTNGDALAAAQG